MRKTFSLRHFLPCSYVLDRKAKFIPPVNCRSPIKQNESYQQPYLDALRVFRIITTHFLQIVKIIALTARNNWRLHEFQQTGNFCFKKVKSEVSQLVGPLIFQRQKLCKIIFAYLKKLFSHDLRIPDSGFRFLFSGEFQFRPIPDCASLVSAFPERDKRKWM